MAQVSAEQFKEKLDKVITAKITPLREGRERRLYNNTLAANHILHFNISDFTGFSGVIITLRVEYGASASNRVRIRWLYSQDDLSYDSVEDAEDAGNYEDLTAASSVIRQRTIIVPFLTYYLRIEIFNPSGNDTVTVKECYTLKLR